MFSALVLDTFQVVFLWHDALLVFTDPWREETLEYFRRTSTIQFRSGL
jgi:hypothetical protein